MKRFCEVAFGVIVVSICLAAQPPATPASDDQIIIKELVITGANDLSSSQIAEAKDSVVGKSGTTENLMDTARHSLTAALKSECYLNPDIELFSAFRKDKPPDDVVMHVTVREGLRYTLRNFRVQWAQAASAKEIEQILPIDDMRRGDCRGLDDVPTTVQDFYQKRGYPNVNVHPLIQPNGATRQFDLTLYIDEGSRSR
jgi:outer membrane protein assembly factor BamA